MKKALAFFATGALVVVLFLPALAFEPTHKFGIAVRASGIAPTNGDFTASGTVNDMFDVGPSFGGQLTYTPIKYITVVGGFDYGWMKIKDGFKPASGAEPNINLPQIFLKGQFNFGSLIENPNNRVNPYVSVGAGLYPWKVTSDGINGDAQLFANGNDFKKTSFGLLGSSGVEVFLIDRLSVFAEGTYHFLFAENKSEFVGSTNAGLSGFTGFDDQGFVTFGGGVTFYLPIGK